MKSIREYENLHIVFWLIKDTCWVSDFKIAGLIMVIPTVIMAFYIAWKSRLEQADLFHNLAVCCWILANCVWMIGEFYYEDGTRLYAKIFFVLGLLFIGYYYMVVKKKNAIPG